MPVYVDIGFEIMFSQPGEELEDSCEENVTVPTRLIASSPELQVKEIVNVFNMKWCEESEEETKLVE